MKSTIHTAALLLGGNLGDVNKTFTEVIHDLSSFSEVERVSSMYKTEAWGMDDAPDFLNQVVVIKTNLEAMDLLLALLNIEKSHGRSRENKDSGYASRVLDIDILTFDNDIYDTPELKIPHPKLHLRNFTLIPLKEVLGDWIHPVLGKDIDELIKASGDKLKVNKL